MPRVCNDVAAKGRRVRLNGRWLPRQYLVRGPLEHPRVIRAPHDGVRLAAVGLAVSKDGPIIPMNHVVDEGRHAPVVQLLCASVRTVHVSERVRLGALARGSLG